MEGRTEDKHSKLRENILALFGIGVFLTIAVALTVSAVFLWEFDAARVSFGLLLLSIIVFYVLWWRGKPRSTGQKIVWGSLSLIGVVLVFGTFPWVSAREKVFIDHQESEELLKNPAELIPDNKPLFAHKRCHDTITVVLGGNIEFGASYFPYAPISIGQQPLITLQVGPKGLLVTFDVLDEQGNLVARVVDNKANVPTAHGYLVPRQSLHRLTVWDEKGSVALDVDFANPTTILITGKLYVTKGNYISFNDGIRLNDNPPTVMRDAFCGAIKGGLVLGAPPAN